MRFVDIFWLWWWSNHPNEGEVEVMDRMDIHPLIFFLCKKKRLDIMKSSYWHIVRETS